MMFGAQDERYSKFIGKMAIVPMTYGRHVPIISTRVKASFQYPIFVAFVLHDSFSSLGIAIVHCYC